MTANIGDTGKLAELDVREGDVVEWSRWLYTVQPRNSLTPTGESGPWAHSTTGGGWINSRAEGVKLIYRAQPPIWRDMTAEAKLEVMMADKNGGPIQFWLDGFWHHADFDSIHDDIAYRVRPPEPKVETVTLRGYASRGYFHTQEGPLDTHRVKYAMIDGVPDCTKCPTCGTAPIDMEEL